MKTRIALYGALREADPRGWLELDVPSGSTIADLRELLAAHLRERAPQVNAGLVRISAFASAEEILHNHREVPDGVELAVLPPVSGG
ncbi:MoaD/ThiS family protein [Dyella sp. LX-66]|uniref:MoaD/ThiS family protein n=1 Tax=unclassified Dyella TaxID=2634549 RepID=UPI001BE0862D|nr:MULTISPECIES: MoaD/ThiS family protein [unclassified Dyella]MBT2117019.1 MoaD/ThiS family protein [Dyella sp. LX-1]MBT2139905.1 MoaD/ThiS family protein [Dyella sp. LX-66]